MSYLLYPGCAAEATTKEALIATRQVLRRLEIDFVESRHLSCCGAGILEEEDPEFEAAINARNFALAEKEGRDIVTLCNTCLLTMLNAKRRFEDDSRAFDQVNRDLHKIGLTYQGKVQVKHLLWAMRDDMGLGWLQNRMKPLSKPLRIAPFYGCHILRPADVLRDETEPDVLSRLIEVAGHTPVEYQEKYSCCGFHILLADESTALKMTEKCLKAADSADIDALVTPCTLCHINLDGYQQRAYSGGRAIPVLHLAQLVGLGMGLDPASLGLSSHMVPLPA